MKKTEERSQKVMVKLVNVKTNSQALCDQVMGDQ